MQPDLFDIVRERDARDKGIEMAASSKADNLTTARAIARQISDQKGRVTADDVQGVLIPQGIDLGNAAGSIFREKGWQVIGYTQSARQGRHASAIRVWHWKGEK